MLSRLEGTYPTAFSVVCSRKAKWRDGFIYVALLVWFNLCGAYFDGCSLQSIVCLNDVFGRTLRVQMGRICFQYVLGSLGPPVQDRDWMSVCCVSGYHRVNRQVGFPDHVQLVLMGCFPQSSQEVCVGRS